MVLLHAETVTGGPYLLSICAYSQTPNPARSTADAAYRLTRTRLIWNHHGANDPDTMSSMLQTAGRGSAGSTSRGTARIADAPVRRYGEDRNGRVRQRGVPRVRDVFPGAPDPGVYLSAVPGRGRSGRPCRGRSSQPKDRRPRLVRGRTVPARSPREDDRLGEVVVVRVAGCRRDLGDAVRVRFGDLPSRPTSCMIPRSWTGAMPAMRRRARRFTSFARTDTAVPRKQGGGRC